MYTAPLLDQQFCKVYAVKRCQHDQRHTGIREKFFKRKFHGSISFRRRRRHGNFKTAILRTAVLRTVYAVWSVSLPPRAVTASALKEPGAEAEQVADDGYRNRRRKIYDRMLLDKQCGNAYKKRRDNKRSLPTG